MPTRISCCGRVRHEEVRSVALEQWQVRQSVPMKSLLLFSKNVGGVQGATDMAIIFPRKHKPWHRFHIGRRDVKQRTNQAIERETRHDVLT